jgi:hypothetical protein
MVRRIVIASLAVILLALVGPAGISTRAEDAAVKPPHAHSHFDVCAKACADCMLQCDSCQHHCAHLVAEGKKDHFNTLRLCGDCAAVCAAAARITSGHGPLSTTICDSCAKACDTCGAACEKFPSDEHMTSCAKACRACAKACRDMIEHAGHAPKEKKP